jgi:hypothetical protein
MPAGYDRAFNERDWLLQGSPTATWYENFSRESASTDLVASLQTGVVTAVACPLIQGDIITKISYVIGATAVGTPTHSWVALYSPAGALLGQSADITSPTAAANTVVTVTLAATQATATTGIYFVAICYTATTVPTLLGKVHGLSATSIAAVNTAFAAYPVIAQNFGSAVGAVAPTTISAATVQTVVPWVVLQ